MTDGTASPARPARVFADRPVAVKILAAVGVVAAVAVGSGVVASRGLDGGADRARLLASEGLASVKDVGDLRADVLADRAALLNHAISTDAASMAKIETALREAGASFDENLASYKKTDMTGRTQAVQQLEQSRAAYNGIRDSEALPASRRNDLEAFRAVRDSKLTPQLEGMTAALDDLEAIEQKSADGLAGAAVDAAGSAKRTVVLFLGAGLLLGLPLAWWVARLITRPLTRVNEVLDGLATGDLTKQAPVDSRDEIGVMAANVNRATVSMRTAMETVSRSSHAVGSSSEELTGVSTTIAASAEQASAQANAVSAAAEQVSRSVQTVATGAEQMGASIREISQNANEAARVVASAVEAAEATNQTVSKLGVSSREIGEVAKVINSIAEQTNLLALNATIEAARAGEAGKGFAVVANEVKELAHETAKATETISSKIQTIQGDAAGAVTAIGGISTVIAQINDYQTTIASAVEQQTATTNEMSRSVTEAATGSNEIAVNISGVAQAAETTSNGVVDSQRAAAELAELSGELQSLVERFHVRV